MGFSSKLKQSIRNYWEDKNTVSIIDKNLHQLEINTVCKFLRPSDYLADVGCGEAKATVQYASRVRKCIGFERSKHLLKKAAKTLAKSGLRNVKIEYGDVLEMKGVPNKFDLVVSQRLLINMASWGDQKQAIINIYNMLKPKGRFIMVENTNDGVSALNKMRVKVGLKPIPRHWHNLYFDYKKLMSFINNKFELLDFYDFGLYYFLTRIYVQMFAGFTGYGKKAVKDPIFNKSDQAARIIFEKFHDYIKISGSRAFGPIQVFVFRRRR